MKEICDLCEHLSLIWKKTVGSDAEISRNLSHLENIFTYSLPTKRIKTIGYCAGILLLPSFLSISQRKPEKLPLCDELKHTVKLKSHVAL